MRKRDSLHLCTALEPVFVYRACCRNARRTIMHSVLHRANSVATFSVFLLAAISGLASLTDVLHVSYPESRLDVSPSSLRDPVATSCWCCDLGWFLWIKLWTNHYAVPTWHSIHMCSWPPWSIFGGCRLVLLRETMRWVFHYIQLPLRERHLEDPRRPRPGTWTKFCVFFAQSTQNEGSTAIMLQALAIPYKD